MTDLLHTSEKVTGPGGWILFVFVLVVYWATH